MGNAPANDVALVHVLAHAGNLAGGGLNTARTGGEDRQTEVDAGRHVGQMTIDMAFTYSGTPTGYYEYAVVKYERSTSVPIIGTDPVPTSAEITSTGLQGAVRDYTPGYVIQFGLIPITSGTTHVRKIKVNWAKFNKAKCRDGDYYCLVVYNRSDTTNVYDLQVRYHTYTVK